MGIKQIIFDICSMRKGITFLFLSILFFSCKKKSTELDINGGVTPFSLEFPIYFSEPFKNNDNPLTEEGVCLGRKLFYEKALSIDSSKSCGSCHLQKFGFSDTARFSKGINNQVTTKKSMGLSNIAWQKQFFWDGRSNNLESQVFFPLESPQEMGLNRQEAAKRLNTNPDYKKLFEKAFRASNITPELIAKAIAQFERTLVSGKSKYDEYKHGRTSLSASELRGERLFFTHPVPEANLRGGNCGDCHSGSLTTSNLFSNNGLDNSFDDIGLEKVTSNPDDKGKFKIVSLRNVALHPPYMHDGRFKTLEDVLDHYNEHIKESTTLDVQIKDATNTKEGTSLGLTAQEKSDIIAFLKTLTDDSFINNKDLSKPL